MTRRGRSAGAGFEVRGRRAVVVGAARSGLAAARLLARRGARVVLTDLRAELPVADAAAMQAAGVELELGRHDAGTFASAALVVLSPGVPPHQPVLDAARSAGVPVIGEIELAWRWLSGRVVAITGTKGKSTTTTLTGRMLREGGLAVLVGGNIGVALSDQVDESTPETWHVVEVSSFQLEVTDTFRPDIAVFLNFSPDHLDRHASVEEYGEAKARIFANQRQDDVAIVNVDDPTVVRFAERTRARLIRLSEVRAEAPAVVVERDAIVWRGEDGVREPLVPVASIRLLGPHLRIDVAAAAAVARSIGVGVDAIERAVAGFTGLEHALEPVATVDGVAFVNDSKATNVEAARRAIESFGEGLVAIVGGRYKGGDLGSLAAPLAARKATVVAIGESAALVAGALDGRVPVVTAGSMAEAVARAFAAAAPGSVVVLAPACASFDWFRDYAERGRVFKEEVRRLAATRVREQ